MKFLVLDSETGGLIANKHSLLQVAMIAWDTKFDGHHSEMNGITGDLMATDEFYIKHRDYCVSPEALMVNKLNILDVDLRGITPQDAVHRIIAFVKDHFPDGKDSFMILGKNPMFDREFISYLMFKYGGYSINKHIPHRAVDISSLVGLLRDMGRYPNDRSTGLYSVASYYGLESGLIAHDAHDDCLLSIQVYSHIRNLLSSSNR